MIRYEFYDKLLQEVHLLIAGATGSGKSVVVNGMLYTALLNPVSDYNFILIDPKRVELAQYKDVPQTICYASEPDTMVNALKLAMDITEKRYRQMQKQCIRKYQGTKILVVIDELADLLTTNRKHVFPLIQRLCQIGRAASIMVIACTQSPIARIIPTELKVNFDSRIALRTACKQDSRNIIGIPGCECLPLYGQCYYKTACSITRWKVPYYTDDTIQELINIWIPPKKRFKFFPW